MCKPTDIDLESFLLWKEFTKDIDPIRNKNWNDEGAIITNNPSFKRGFKSESVSVSVKQIEKPKSSINFQVDKRTEDKLRKGKMPIDGTLDLHGLNQGQAYAALENAVLKAFSKKKRCLLVITGKGNTGKTSNDWLTPSVGVLKLKVPEWLSIPPFSNYVLKFVQAKPNHGGSGALYVYLRRNK